MNVTTLTHNQLISPKWARSHSAPSLVFNSSGHPGSGSGAGNVKEEMEKKGILLEII